MRITKWNLFIGLVLLASLMTGCSKVHDRVGPKVNFYPVTAVLNLNITNYKTARTSVADFINKNHKATLTQNIALQYQGKQGRRLAIYARNSLLKSGVDARQITLQIGDKAKMPADSFSMALTEYKVSTAKCRYINYNSLSQFNDDFGCSVESNRWLSMTNPERSAAIVTEAN